MWLIGIIPGNVFKFDMQLFVVYSAVLAEKNTFCEWQMSSIMCTYNSTYNGTYNSSYVVTVNKNINLI